MFEGKLIPFRGWCHTSTQNSIRAVLSALEIPTLQKYSEDRQEYTPEAWNLTANTYRSKEVKSSLSMIWDKKGGNESLGFLYCF